MIRNIQQLLIIVAATTALYACGTPAPEETGAVQLPEITQEVKPWTRWWIPGSAWRNADITELLEAYEKAGLGGVEITTIYGVRGYEDRFMNFLSPQWMEKFVFALHEAERIGMGVDLANASGWPFGGPWVPQEIACKNVMSRVWTLHGGETLTDPVVYTQSPLLRAIGKRTDIARLKEPVAANDSLQEYAFDQVRFPKQLPLIVVTANKVGARQVIDLTEKVVDGKLEWTAPDGEWLICALFQGYHGKMVERAGPGGEGDVIDHFSETAIRQYLAKFDEAFKGYDLHHLRYYFSDSYEVDDAAGESGWTPDFPEEFKKRRGYDLLGYLPALLSRDSAEINARVLYDYRRTINDLLLEEYTANWQQWAARQGKGIRNQAHGSPANVLDLYAQSDVPEIEGYDIVDIKSAPSAAHVTGKKLTSCEAATWLGEHFTNTLGGVKEAVDKHLLGGVNHVFYHGTCFSPSDAPWPGWLFYAAVHFQPENSFWDDFGSFNQYVARCQSALQAGKPNNDILVYFTISDLWSKAAGRGSLLRPAGLHSGTQFGQTSLGESAHYITGKGWSWDAVSDRQIAELTAGNGNIRTGGVEYRTLLVPECTYMPAETFEHILGLAKKGATVLFHKHLPQDVAGYARLEADRKKFNEQVASLDFTETNGIRKAAYGKGTVLVADDLDALLNGTAAKREPMYDKGLQCIRRLKDDGNLYYFVKNTSEEAVAGWIPLNTQASTVAIYNPMTGASGYARLQDGQSGKEVYLQLSAGETCILETYRGVYQGDAYAYYATVSEPQPLVGEWQLAFVKGGPSLPQPRTLATLVSWTETGDEELNAFSGTAEYTVTLPAMETTADGWQIDFGKIAESASVYINDQYVETLLAAPYRITIDKNILKGNDKLTVKVSNLMENRIASLDKQNVTWKIFYNVNFPARRRENTGSNGLFSAAEWSPAPSGLLGPVTIAPVALVK
ncbi:MAG: glycoside hydrolase family 2 protein [Bacteroidales bacterium]|nr:glycoside hydrolase family 2 protein [Bacteroidales bacterium]